jgi:hypothetical protein
MVHVPESEAASAIYDLLQSNGWREPEIKSVKLLNQPFRHDDPVMRACYKTAIEKAGGFVIYTDPIDET